MVILLLYLDETSNEVFQEDICNHYPKFEQINKSLFNASK